MLNNLIISMNSVRLVNYDNYQRRSGAVRHVSDGAKSDSAEHDSVSPPLSANPLAGTLGFHNKYARRKEMYEQKCNLVWQHVYDVQGMVR